MNLPFLTSEIPGIAGIIRSRPEDFFVEELPLYEPCGQGQHVYCEIEKTGLTTFEAVDRIARALGISARDIGYAGIKDARAVARQTFSISGIDEQAVAALRIAGITVRRVARHGNKLRLGHLRGNRFVIKLRGVVPADAARAQQVLQIVERRGMPNYFGPQRFGRRQDNHLLGAALIRGDAEDLLRLLLGNPDSSLDDAQTMGARKAFERGDLRQAMHLWPRRCGMERRVLHRLLKTGNPEKAVAAIDERLRRLWVSALQSEAFNEVVSRRIDSLDRLMAGDLAFKHDNGACFRVVDAAAEQSRCDAFEISPTGPLVGYRMTLPEGQPLEIERSVLAAAGIDPADFRDAGRLKVKGARRPLRVRPEETSVATGTDDAGEYLQLSFTLPAGAFATSLLREITKRDVT